jgi:hypothetical protein
MCNLYSETSNQDAIRDLVGAFEDRVGNLPLWRHEYPQRVVSALAAMARTCEPLRCTGDVFL